MSRPVALMIGAVGVIVVAALLLRPSGEPREVLARAIETFRRGDCRALEAMRSDLERASAPASPDSFRALCQAIRSRTGRSAGIPYQLTEVQGSSGGPRATRTADGSYSISLGRVPLPAGTRLFSLEYPPAPNASGGTWTLFVRRGLDQKWYADSIRILMVHIRAQEPSEAAVAQLLMSAMSDAGVDRIDFPDTRMSLRRSALEPVTLGKGDLSTAARPIEP